MSLHVVLLGLERAELLLQVGDDVLVLQDRLVLREVDGLGLLGELLDLAAGGIVAGLEVLERIRGSASETKLGAQVGPVDLCGGRTLRSDVSSLSRGRRKSRSSRSREGKSRANGDDMGFCWSRKGMETYCGRHCERVVMLRRVIDGKRCREVA